MTISISFHAHVKCATERLIRRKQEERQGSKPQEMETTYGKNFENESDSNRTDNSALESQVEDSEISNLQMTLPVTQDSMVTKSNNNSENKIKQNSSVQSNNGNQKQKFVIRIKKSHDDRENSSVQLNFDDQKQKFVIRIKKSSYNSETHGLERIELINAHPEPENNTQGENVMVENLMHIADGSGSHEKGKDTVPVKYALQRLIRRRLKEREIFEEMRKLRENTSGNTLENSKRTDGSGLKRQVEANDEVCSHCKKQKHEFQGRVSLPRKKRINMFKKACSSQIKRQSRVSERYMYFCEKLDDLKLKDREKISTRVQSEELKKCRSGRFSVPNRMDFEIPGFLQKEKGTEKLALDCNKHVQGSEGREEEQIDQPQIEEGAHHLEHVERQGGSQLEESQDNPYSSESHGVQSSENNRMIDSREIQEVCSSEAESSGKTDMYGSKNSAMENVCNNMGDHNWIKELQTNSCENSEIFERGNFGHIALTQDDLHLYKYLHENVARDQSKKQNTSAVDTVHTLTEKHDKGQDEMSWLPSSYVLDEGKSQSNVNQIYDNARSIQIKKEEEEIEKEDRFVQQSSSLQSEDPSSGIQPHMHLQTFNGIGDNIRIKEEKVEEVEKYGEMGQSPTPSYIVYLNNLSSESNSSEDNNLNIAGIVNSKPDQCIVSVIRNAFCQSSDDTALGNGISQQTMNSVRLGSLIFNKNETGNVKNGNEDDTNEKTRNYEIVSDSSSCTSTDSDSDISTPDISDSKDVCNIRPDCAESSKLAKLLPCKLVPVSTCEVSVPCQSVLVSACEGLVPYQIIPSSTCEADDIQFKEEADIGKGGRFLRHMSNLESEDLSREEESRMPLQKLDVREDTIRIKEEKDEEMEKYGRLDQPPTESFCVYLNNLPCESNCSEVNNLMNVEEMNNKSDQFMGVSVNRNSSYQSYDGTVTMLGGCISQQTMNSVKSGGLIVNKNETENAENGNEDDINEKTLNYEIVSVSSSCTSVESDSDISTPYISDSKDVSIIQPDCEESSDLTGMEPCENIPVSICEKSMPHQNVPVSSCERLVPSKSVPVSTCEERLVPCQNVPVSTCKRSVPHQSVPVSACERLMPNQTVSVSMSEESNSKHLNKTKIVKTKKRGCVKKISSSDTRNDILRRSFNKREVRMADGTLRIVPVHTVQCVLEYTRASTTLSYDETLRIHKTRSGVCLLMDRHVTVTDSDSGLNLDRRFKYSVEDNERIRPLKIPGLVNQIYKCDKCDYWTDIQDVLDLHIKNHKGQMTLNVGDKVKVNLCLEDFMSVQEAKVDEGWNIGMIQCMEEDGTLLDFTGLVPGTCTVQYQDNRCWRIHQFALTQVYTFTPGERVQVLKGLKKCKRLQEGHGGWHSQMGLLWGEQGILNAIDTEEGDFHVRIKNKIWIFNPVCVEPVKKQYGQRRCSEPPRKSGHHLEAYCMNFSFEPTVNNQVWKEKQSFQCKLCRYVDYDCFGVAKHFKRRHQKAAVNFENCEELWQHFHQQ